MNKPVSLFEKVDTFEYSTCLYFNRLSHQIAVGRFFSVVSRLGDGVFWYILIALLPLLFGYEGLVVGCGMLIAGVANVSLYKYLKSILVRERPYISFTDLECGTPPLDRYSFPSGHTLHAVCFATITTYFFPALWAIAVPMAALIAASRVILGLHYPSDVIVGALIGSSIAMLSIMLIDPFLIV